MIGKMKSIDSILRRLVDERSTLLIGKRDSSSTRQTNGTFDNPDESKDGKCESGPMDEGRRFLVGIDSPERPSDGNGRGDVAFRR